MIPVCLSGVRQLQTLTYRYLNCDPDSIGLGISGGFPTLKCGLRATTGSAGTPEVDSARRERVVAVAQEPNVEARWRPAGRGKGALGGDVLAAQSRVQQITRADRGGTGETWRRTGRRAETRRLGGPFPSAGGPSRVADLDEPTLTCEYFRREFRLYSLAIARFTPLTIVETGLLSFSNCSAQYWTAMPARRQMYA